MKRRLLLLLAVAAATASLAFALTANASREANQSCFDCHGSSGWATNKVDFEVAPVDRSKCNNCHWYGVHDFDVYHVEQNTAPDYMSRQCSQCHGRYPTRPLIIGWPTSFSPYGWFQSPASLESSPGALHARHVNGSWLKDDPACASCHGVAACGACHGDPAETHAEHGSLGPRELPVVHSIGKKYGDACPDTYLYGYAPNTVYDAASAMFVGQTASGEYRALIRFPLTKAQGSTFSTATLSLTRSSGAAFPLRAYRLRRTNWMSSQATWSVYKSASPWGLPGAKSAALDYYPDLFAESSSGIFDVTALLQAAIAEGQTNLDLLIVDPAPVPRRYNGFYSSNGVYADWYPWLKIEGSRTVGLYAYGPVSGTEIGDPEMPEYITPTRTCVAEACHALSKASTEGFVPACAATCHTDRSILHGYTAARHTANARSASISVGGVSYGPFACDACHSLELGAEHTKASSSQNARGCAECHPTPRGSFTAWDRDTCEQGGCHAVGSSAGMHGGIDASHQVLPENGICFGSDCHADGDLAALHAEATVGSGGTARTSCMVCHAAAVPTSRNCATCHADKIAPDGSVVSHGYDPAKHAAQEECIGSCHSTDLKTAHGTRPCSTCHAGAVDAIRPWDKSCRVCHGDPTHTSALGSHVGNDIDPNGYGCGSTDGSRPYCHDITDVGVLHAPVIDGSGGCPVCHATGVTPTTTCRTCHLFGGSETGHLHHDNVRYLYDRSDAPSDSYTYEAPPNTPPHGWNDDLLYYDCQWCHEEFGATTTSRRAVMPYEGSKMWYSEIGSDFAYPMNSSLYLTTVTVPADGALDFMTDWDLEEGFDYGYVEVSTPTTWTSLPSNITTTSNPYGRNQGNGITGRSGGWVAVHVDLSAYAGKQVRIRFRYNTDTEVFGSGWAIDAIRVSGPGGTVFADNAETAGGGTSTWWWRTGGPYPTPLDPNWD